MPFTGEPWISAVVLAAGRSTRFGTDHSKMLQEYRREPLLFHAIRAVLTVDPHELLIVLPGNGDDLFDLLRAPTCPFRDRIEISWNPQPESGLAGSIVRGVADCHLDTDGILIALGDMPWMNPATLGRLRARWLRLADRGHKAVVPVNGDRPGNPVLFGCRGWRRELMELRGDQGARKLLRNRPGDVVPVPVDDGSEFDDVDRLEDLIR